MSQRNPCYAGLTALNDSFLHVVGTKINLLSLHPLFPLLHLQSFEVLEAQMLDSLVKERSDFTSMVSFPVELQDLSSTKIHTKPLKLSKRCLNNHLTKEGDFLVPQGLLLP